MGVGTAPGKLRDPRLTGSRARQRVSRQSGLLLHLNVVYEPGFAEARGSKHHQVARVGTRRTNKRRGGGTAKGPKPRDYEYHLPKKAVRAATRMALLSKFQDQEAVVIDDLSLSEIKTKQMAGILKALKLQGITCLVSTAQADPQVYKSARNIAGVNLLPTSQFNTYTVLKHKRLVLTKAAFEELRKGKKEE